MSDVPTDLVIEILARVPVTDLLRFRCVCKTWRSMFQDMSFIGKQTTHVTTIMTHLMGKPTTCTYEGQKLEMIFKEPEINNGGLKRQSLLKTIVNGYGDGLLGVLFNDGSFGIWNPILGELRKISAINLSQTWTLIGFGYDQSIQDHKIVLISHFLTSSPKAQVLRLKSSVPRMIDFPWRKDWKCDKKEGILVGETIFWLLNPNYGNSIEISKDILVFSVVSETFNYCSSPAPTRETEVYRKLTVLRGSLCVVEEYFNHMVVWCADHEKGDKGRIKSWTKVLRLKASHIERATRWQVSKFRLGTVLNQAGSLLIIVSTGEWVTRKWETKLCEYNLEKGTIRKVEASLPRRYYSEMNEFIATLVPARAY